MIKLISMAYAISVFAVGSLIAIAAGDPSPTFNKEVSPILFKSCTNCHRPGANSGGRSVSVLRRYAALGRVDQRKGPEARDAALAGRSQRKREIPATTPS